MIADYGHGSAVEPDAAWRSGSVQLADGREDTQPNADGDRCLELLSEAGFREVREAEAVPTVTGSISVYRCAQGMTVQNRQHGSRA